MTAIDGYPYHLAGPDAGPPVPVNRRVFEMAVRAHERNLAGVDPLAAGPAPAATNWRLAGSIAELLAEANAFDPNRNKASDGTIGDARHIGEGSDSDHNPWIVVAGLGVVRAGDITNDPAMDLADVAERIRAKAHSGGLPMVTGGGYVILNRRITKDDFSGWKEYTGTDPHVSHMHVSSSRIVAQFDARTSWSVFAAVPAPAPVPPSPSPAPQPAGFTGPDLTGSGPALRGLQGYNGPRVQLWQTALANRYPGYTGACGQLVADGWWGPVTTRWTAEYAHRSGIAESDGTNIGPKIANAAYRAGIRV